MRKQTSEQKTNQRGTGEIFRNWQGWGVRAELPRGLHGPPVGHRWRREALLKIPALPEQTDPATSYPASSALHAQNNG